jgi:hypothetical protein
VSGGHLIPVICRPACSVRSIAGFADRRRGRRNAPYRSTSSRIASRSGVLGRVLSVMVVVGSAVGGFG